MINKIIISNFQLAQLKLSSFQRLVLAAVNQIPAGQIITYQSLAQAIGQPKAVRAVSQALAKNPFLIKIPCHRVVKVNGTVGGYCLGVRKKIELLKKEGLEFEKQNKIKNFKKFFHQF